MSKILFPRHLLGWSQVGQINIGDLKIALNKGTNNQSEITIMSGDCVLSKVLSNDACRAISNIFGKVKTNNEVKSDFEVIDG